MSAIVYRPYRPEDEAGLRAMFRAVYGPDAEHRTSAWRYLAPAPWPAVIQVAEADGRIVGAQPSHGIDLLVDGQPVKGLLLLDVMTHPEYRRRGVFAGVVEGLRERAAAEGYRVLLTTPNKDAERGFERLPAWKRMGELVPWIFMADPAVLIAGGATWARALSPLTSVWRLLLGSHPSNLIDHGESCPDREMFDALWKDARDTARIQMVRDAKFMRWRFGPNSERHYRFGTLAGAAALGATVVTRRRLVLGRPVMLVADIIASPHGLEHLETLLRHLAHYSLAERSAGVLCWTSCGSPFNLALAAAGYRQVPRLLRVRPYAVWASVDPSDLLATTILNLDAWHMTIADSDLA